MNQDEYHRERLVDLINLNPNKPRSVTPLDITKIFYISDFEEAMERDPVNQIAELLRLENYEWNSYEYVQQEYKDNPTEMNNKGIEIVNGIFTF
ncbi:hypothetical protein B0G52_105137 [Cohnella sp. SGD-V74]|nr:hypothetical protein B0G52_105137 [Cohnella sp. SGD-V74]